MIQTDGSYTYYLDMEYIIIMGQKQSATFFQCIVQLGIDQINARDFSFCSIAPKMNFFLNRTVCINYQLLGIAFENYSIGCIILWKWVYLQTPLQHPVLLLVYLESNNLYGHRRDEYLTARVYWTDKTRFEQKLIVRVLVSTIEGYTATHSPVHYTE